MQLNQTLQKGKKIHNAGKTIADSCKISRRGRKPSAVKSQTDLFEELPIEIERDCLAHALKQDGASVEIKESGVIEARMPNNPYTRRVIFEFSKRKNEDIFFRHDPVALPEGQSTLLLLLNL